MVGFIAGFVIGVLLTIMVCVGHMTWHSTSRADAGSVDAHDGRRHACMLRWYRTVGYARHAGVSVDMHEPPAIAGDDIEYLPGVRTLIDGRAMTSDEISATQKLLVQMSEDARDALQGTSTLAVVIRGREP